MFILTAACNNTENHHKFQSKIEMLIADTLNKNCKKHGKRLTIKKLYTMPRKKAYT